MEFVITAIFLIWLASKCSSAGAIATLIPLTILIGIGAFLVSFLR